MICSGGYGRLLLGRVIMREVIELLDRADERRHREAMAVLDLHRWAYDRAVSAMAVPLVHGRGSVMVPASVDGDDE